MRRKHHYLILTAAGAVLGVGSASIRAQTVTLSISAANGYWTAYATTDSSTDSVGVANFCIDVKGSHGVSVTSSGLDIPPGSFGDMQEPGIDGIAIVGAQDISVGPGLDGLVVENYAKLNAPDTYTDPQTGESYNWSVPASIAEGTYSGNEGILTVTPDDSIGVGIDTLNIVSDGHWVGPINETNDTVIPGSVQIVPEPDSIGLLALTSIGLAARRRKRIANVT